jgi:hypothetical protein
LHFPERRTSTRFRGKLPVEFEYGTGVTRDFGSSGVYFVTDQVFSAGEPIEFFLCLDHTGIERRVRLRCEGEVRRVEPEGEKVGVAIAIGAYEFEGLNPDVFEATGSEGRDNHKVTQPPQAERGNDNA